MAEASVLAAPSADLVDNSRRAISAAAIGNLLEWYDFGVYAYLAGLIATKFFPNSDPTASLLAAFAAYGVGFLARPLGGIVIGRLGDTKGRKAALLLTIFLMALGTVGLGVLPSYEAIGVWAPILLVCLRIVQGLAAGGEWGTSTAFMVEWAPPDRRGLFGSFQQVSTAGGSLLGSAVAAIMTSSLSQAEMLDWGWRVPFLLGVLLLFVGAYLRRNVEETPSYEASRKAAEQPVVAGLPLGALAFGFTIFWTVAYYTLLAWMPSFTQRFAGLTPSQALWSNTIGLIAMVIAVPFWGALSDKVGRKPLLMASAISIGLLAYPLFSLMTNGTGFALVIPLQILLGILLALYSGAGPAAISEIFPTHLRSTWMSSGYALSVAIFGGFAPFIATWLIQATGSPVSPTYLYLLPSAVISLLVIWSLKETAGTKLR
ncbi:major facilitator transporter [Bradyrhizobium sp. LTSPM299]|uniref:MFS transporter n=1 Tax=Bradyrhizobium sp. LTSPM299 TaxID=1619233 RepID=UPI0005C8BE0E|nr:MFS transporter [Bradyrhizobium sp. LTSPM299]KJC54928.1 major facilitator transporter [Bradyrhizobium sp. LTSPM299]